MPIAADRLDEAEEWMRLLLVPNLPVPLALRAVQTFGGVAEALSAPLKELAREVGGRMAETMRAVGRGARDDELDVALNWLTSRPQTALLPLYDPLYPQQLIEAGTAPLALFLCGNAEVLHKQRVAVVGTSRPDAEGRTNAADFGAALARAGAVSVAALEMPDDVGGAVLEGALSVKGAPIALLATGPDRALSAISQLQHRVVDEGGLLISAAFPGASTDEHSRRVRDALLANFAPRLLVIEAERNDSVMNIARQAADAGVQVGAVPGSIHNPAYKGCHQLIRDGAALVEMITDIGLRKAPAGKLMT